MKYQCLPLPLNVYALTLELEYGHVEHLHFGLYAARSETEDSYPAAQQRAQEQLCYVLRPAPASVLEIGFGTGALAMALAAKGYQVTALSSVAAELQALTREDHACVSFIQGAVATYQPDQLFDVLLLQQSAQYVDPLELLAFARKYLAKGGQLLLAEEFVLSDSDIGPEPRPLLRNFLQLVQRCGFSIQYQLELGQQIAPGLKKFIALIRKHHDALCQHLDVSAEQLTYISEGLEAMAEKYARGQLGYTILDLRKGDDLHSQRVFGSIAAFEPAEIAPLFEQSFDTHFDPDIWHWKYGHGRGRAVCVRENETILAHYGGAPRDILYFNAKHKALQICDVMVLPEYRSFVSRDTLFFKTAATLLEQQVGNCAEHLLGFGFPNQRVLKVARRLGLYDTTDRFIEIDYPVDESDTSRSGYEVEVFSYTNPDAKGLVNTLWKTMAVSFEDKIIGIRDWEYLQYRYFNHPLWWRGEYECLQVRCSGTSAVLALAFFKPHDGGRLLMDLIGEVQAFPEVLTALRDYLADHSFAMRSRITHAHAHTLSLKASQQYDLGIEIPCNVWTKGPAANTLRGAWWLTAGDMDFL